MNLKNLKTGDSKFSIGSGSNGKLAEKVNNFNDKLKDNLDESINKINDDFKRITDTSDIESANRDIAQKIKNFNDEVSENITGVVSEINENFNSLSDLGSDSGLDSSSNVKSVFGGVAKNISGGGELTSYGCDANYDTQDEVYEYLTDELGFNSAVAKGIMGNIAQESSFNTTANCIDTNGLTSYGLFQWNGSRYTNLKSYCIKHGYSYSSTEGQMAFLKYELETSKPEVYATMKTFPNTEEGALMACEYWRKNFEVASASSSDARKNNTRGYY